MTKFYSKDKKNAGNSKHFNTSWKMNKFWMEYFNEVR